MLFPKLVFFPPRPGFPAPIIWGNLKNIKTRRISSEFLPYCSQIQRQLLHSEIYSVPVIPHKTYVFLSVHNWVSSISSNFMKKAYWNSCADTFLEQCRWYFIHFIAHFRHNERKKFKTGMPFILPYWTNANLIALCNSVPPFKTIKAYRRCRDEGQPQLISSSASDWGDLLTSSFGRFNPREKTP